MNAPRPDKDAPTAPPRPGPAWLRVAPPAPAPAYHVSLDPLAGEITLGRRSDAGLRLADAALSRDHARLTADPAGWWLTDLESRNGTAVNGLPLDPGVPRRLAAGDVVAAGPFTLTFHPGAAPRPAFEPAADGLSRLTDLDPPRVDTALLRGIQQLGGTLQGLGTPAERHAGLCAFLTASDGLGARHAAVLGFPPPGGAPPAVRSGPFAAPGARDTDFYLSRGLLSAVVEHGEAVLATGRGVAAPGDAGAGPAVELSVALPGEPVAVVACPLAASAPPSSGDPAAEGPSLLYAVLPGRCGTGEWLALTALAAGQFDLAEAGWAARHAETARAKVDAELDRARAVQMALVPAPEVIATRARGLAVATHFAPCLAVGGDYLDVVPLADGTPLLLVMDVCGKGLPAALVSSSLHTFVHATASRTADVGELIDALNRYLCDALDDRLFVTGVAIAVDPETGAAVEVNLGHPPTLILNLDGTRVPDAAPANLPLGLAPDPPTGRSFTLEPGQTLALYSDGLSEVTDDTGAWIGPEGVAEHLAVAADAADPGDLAAQAAALVHRLDGVLDGRQPDDDMTLLLARR